MDRELERYIKGQTRRAPRNERELVAPAKRIYDQTRLAGLEVDAAVALGDHIMERLVRHDRRRRHLAQGDMTLNLLLADIEAETVEQVKRIQNRHGDGWGM